jgi:hypothetical protein
MRLAGLLLAASLATSCMTEPSAPQSVAGSYSATRLRFTQTGLATVDALSAGATIAMTLLEDGTTSGGLVIPAALNDGVAETLDLTGTFQYTSGVVTFSHTSDTFIRDVPWTAGTNTLVTTATAGGIQYDVILTKN